MHRGRVQFVEQARDMLTHSSAVAQHLCASLVSAPASSLFPFPPSSPFPPLPLVSTSPTDLDHCLRISFQDYNLSRRPEHRICQYNPTLAKMSGLEPLAALGLACNILQLVEVGCKTIKLAKDIYQSSSPAVNQALQDHAALLNTISGEVKAAQRPANPSRIDRQLLTTADKCFTAARDLQEEVHFLLSNAKQNQLAATLKVVAKTTWRRRRLNRLKESLEGAEKMMRETLLAQIW